MVVIHSQTFCNVPFGYWLVSSYQHTKPECCVVCKDSWTIGTYVLWIGSVDYRSIPRMMRIDKTCIISSNLLKPKVTFVPLFIYNTKKVSVNDLFLSVDRQTETELLRREKGCSLL